MKRKGFTLIELLAVIVVLAIIALIATPIVMNTIKSTKKGAAERSADSYISAVETTVATAKLDGKDIPDGTYTIDSDGNLTGTGLPDGKLTIDMKGNKPKSGTITIKNGQVTNDSKMTVGDYDVKYNEDNKKYEATEKTSSTKTYSNGEVVYFNVTTGEKCSISNYIETQVSAGETKPISNYYTEAQSNIGVKEGCMKFYAFNDDGGDTVNLILDHNTTAFVAWGSSAVNTDGPVDLLEQLKKDTSSWQGTKTPANYIMDQTGQTSNTRLSSNAKYTIDYSSYKARLITAQEVAQIMGYTSFDEKTATEDWIYFDTNTETASDICKEGNTTGCQYGWLYDRTHTSCKTNGCLNNSNQNTTGYWTSSSCANNYSQAWRVLYDGRVKGDGVTHNNPSSGVRPVIIVSKSKLS